MTNKEAIEILTNVKSTPQITWTNGADVAFDIAIKALDMVEQLENMRDNAYRLYKVEQGDNDYSYGRKQVLGTVHSDLEELLEGFDRGSRE